MIGEWIRPLCCPHCNRPLIDWSRTWKCSVGHTFDVAREGYVNLLSGHKKLPETVGDTPDMLRARQAFLAGGFYEPLSDLLNELVVTAVNNVNKPTQPVVVDIGCGEGYYLRRLAQQFAGQSISLFGVDIAKTAVRVTAKQLGKDAHCLVADVNNRLPFTDHSVQVLTNLFAPRNAIEFARLVVPGGTLLTVVPAQDHLESLRQHLRLLGMQAEKQAHITAQFASSFTLQQVYQLAYPMLLTGKALHALVRMMPSIRHLPDEQREMLNHLPQVETVASFLVLQFIRVGSDRLTG